jgi:hypothetical protein
MILFISTLGSASSIKRVVDHASEASKTGGIGSDDVFAVDENAWLHSRCRTREIHHATA